jgi:hypothetical protein
VKNKAKSMLIIFFNLKGISHKEFVLAGQTASFEYYCDVLRRLNENVQRLRPQLWRQKNWMSHHDNAPSCTSLFTRDFSFMKNNRIVVPHPLYFSVSPIEDKTERPPF